MLRRTRSRRRSGLGAIQGPSPVRGGALAYLPLRRYDCGVAPPKLRESAVHRDTRDSSTRTSKAVASLCTAHDRAPAFDPLAHFLSLYEECYQFPCFGEWPPTEASLAERSGASTRDVRDALRRLEASGALAAVKTRHPTAPIRDLEHIDPQVLHWAVGRELMQRGAAAHLNATDFGILNLWWSLIDDEGHEPTPEILAPKAGIHPRRAKERLEALRERGLLEPFRFPVGAGDTVEVF